MASSESASMRGPVYGPRLTDHELFEAIDPLAHGLASARVRAFEGNFPEAKRALADHLRSRTDVSWLDDSHRGLGPSALDLTADDVLSGRVVVVGIPHRFRGGTIDWLYNPTLVDEDYAPDHEWQWQLNRMSFWNLLGAAYRSSGDERYTRAFVEQLRGWARQCPRPEGLRNAPGSAWRTIECGLRMSGSWPNAFHNFLKSPFFTDDDVVLFLKLCIEHARQLRSYATSGNWLTMEMNGLYTVGGLFPELREAAEWRAYASRRLHGELNAQFLPDGAQIELTSSYHRVALNNIIAVYDKAAVFGRLGELPEDFAAGAERPYDFILGLMTPDRDMPHVNDSASGNMRRELRKAAMLFPDRADFTWVATDGEKGRPPSWTSRAFDWAGYVAMRSGWESDANYLCFDAGPLGYGHVHQDKLNVIVYAYGREILFDAGGGPYEKSHWRAYDTDTYSHNTVLVDGEPQRRQTRDRRDNVSKSAIDLSFASSEVYDYAAGSYTDGYGTEDARLATHSRRVLMLKPDLFVVADTLQPADDDEHFHQARWHLDSTEVEIDEHTSAATTLDPGLPNLSIVPLQTDALGVMAATAEREPELLGWRVLKTARPTPATTVLHQIQAAGTAQLVTLLIPRKPGSPLSVADVHTTDELSYEIALSDGRRLDVAVDPDPAGRIRISETLADGSPGRRVE
jgi:hypothetical protein